MPPSDQETADYEEYEESVFEYQSIDRGNEEELFWGDEVSNSGYMRA